MSAPADSPTRPTDPANTPPPPPEHRWPPPGDRGRPPRPSLSPAAWLASTGAALLFVASVIVVASRWQSIPPEARFSGLVAALLAVWFVAEAGRQRLPTTARSLAALAAATTAPVGVAAAATLDQPWPVCVLVGGAVAVGAIELQSRRWRLPALGAATVPGVAMAATGGAALTGVPVGLIVALVAGVALAAGAVRRAVALGVAVGLSPALTPLADAGLGPGTLERIGAVGDGLAWSAPVSGAIAALVVGIVAQRLQHLPLAAGALAVLISGVVTGLVAGDVGAAVWWCLPAIALLGLESLGSARSPAVWRRLASICPLLAVPLAVGGALAPLVLVADRVGGREHSSTWALPLLLTAVALLASSTGSARADRTGWTPAAYLLGAAGHAVGAATLTGAPLVGVAALALALWVAISALTDWRTWEVTTAVVAAWGLLAVTADPAHPVWAQLALVAGFGVALVLAISFVDRSDEGIRLIVAALVIGGATHLVVEDGRAVGALLGIVAMVVGGVALRPGRALVPMSVAETAVVLSFLDGRLDWWNVGLVTALAAATAAAADRSPRSPWAHVAAGLAVAAGALSLFAAGLDPMTVTLVLGVGAVALTGLATIFDAPLPHRTAAAVAGALALGASLGADPVVVSLAATLVGAQAIVIGATAGHRPLSAAGAAVVAGSVLSLWWTTGTNALVLDAIAPYGATGADIVVAATGAVLLGFGWAVRRAVRPSSWLAYSPGLGLLATWLLSSQLEPGTDWATLGALAVGVVASGVGGIRRLGAPLVIGTATIVGTLFVSAGPRLAAAPTWAWIATGGLGLLVLAALVERNERPLLPGRNGGTSLIETFREEFE